MHLVELLNNLSKKINLILILISSIAIFAMMMHITADVILRSTLDLVVPATERIVTRYYMVALALLPLGWVELQKNMIIVDAFTSLFSKKINLSLDLFANFIAIGVYLVLGIATLEQALEQFKIGSYIMSLNLVIPLWPTYFFVPIAFFVAMLACTLKALDTFISARSSQV